MQTKNAFLNKGTGLLIIEAINSNPNGDPDRESDPRHRAGGIGEISAVSVKAKIRSLIDDKEGPVWQTLGAQAGLDPSCFEILERQGRRIADLKRMPDDELLNRFWDARVFGLALLEKEGKAESKGQDEEGEQPEAEKKKRKGKVQTETQETRGGQHIHTGPIQFGTGISLAPVEIIRSTTTIRRQVQEAGGSRGMAPLAHRVVAYGIYSMPFFLNPSVAFRTNCSAEDINLLMAVLPYQPVEIVIELCRVIPTRRPWRWRWLLDDRMRSRRPCTSPTMRFPDRQAMPSTTACKRC